MSADIDTWNTRAAWCLVHTDDLEARARAVVDRWRMLTRAIVTGRRELYAAAHQGLQDGPVADLVREHREGCLVLAGAVGDGKTTGAAWRCYTGTEAVLWLEAPTVGGNDAKAHRELLRKLEDPALVVLDDVGAPGSTGQYEAPKVIEVLRRLGGRSAPSIVTTNLPRTPQPVPKGEQPSPTFGDVYDGEEHGRMVDRLTMAPNRFVELPITAQSRRATAKPPPETDPPPVARARSFLTDLALCRITKIASVAFDVHADAVRRVAGKLGIRSDDQLDAKVRAHDEARAGVLALSAALADEHRAAGGTT